jgi:hypothetical protein
MVTLGTGAESQDPEDVSFTMPIQGVLSMQFSENALMLHIPPRILGVLRLRAHHLVR